MYKQKDLSSFSNENAEINSHLNKEMLVEEGLFNPALKFPRPSLRELNNFEFCHFLQAGIVHDLDTLNAVRCLLYHRYIQEMKWEVEQNNYSGIRIERVGQQFQLVDDYDSCSTWFSVKQKNAVIACVRLCPEDTSGRLELERYPEARKALSSHLLELKQNFHVFELNREAILPHYATEYFARSLLLKAVFEYCLRHQRAIITATHLEEWATLYERISFPKLEGRQFKYAETDSKMATVYFAGEKGIRQMCDQLNIILKETEVEKC